MVSKSVLERQAGNGLLRNKTFLTTRVTPEDGGNGTREFRTPPIFPNSGVVKIPRCRASCKQTFRCAVPKDKLQDQALPDFRFGLEVPEPRSLRKGGRRTAVERNRKQKSLRAGGAASEPSPFSLTIPYVFHGSIQLQIATTREWGRISKLL